jgi:hypothetical protein
MWQTEWSSDRFDRALAGSGRDVTKLQLWGQQGLITADAPFSTCTVKEKWGTGIRMSLSLTVEPSRQWLTWLEQPLTAQVYRGIEAGTHSEMFPWGAFELDSPKRSVPVSLLEFTSDDRWTWVIRDDFATNKAAYVGKLKDSAYALMAEVNLWPEVTATSEAIQPPAIWEKSRSETLAEMMAAMGADAYVSRIGRGVIEDHYPEVTDSVLRDGSGGTVVTAVVEPDLGSLYNVVYVTSSAQDVWFEPQQVQVTNPSHPAHPNKIGRRVRRFASPLLFNADQAQQAGVTLLSKESQLARRYTITCIPDPRREVGDLITVQTDLGTEPCVIEEINLPNEGPMTVVAAVNTLGFAL